MPTKKKAATTAAPKKVETVERPFVRHAAVQESLPDRDVYWSDEATRKAHSK